MPETANWSTSGGNGEIVCSYDLPLYTGETTGPTEGLKINVSVADGAEVKAGDPIDVIVTYESVPAVFNANGSPDQSTAWSIASAITAING